MIIACSNCQTAYDIDAHGLGSGGRMVRCAQCGTKWFQEPGRGAPRPVVRRAQPRRRARQDGGRLAEAGAAYPAPPWPPAPAYPPPPGYVPQGYVPQGYPQPYASPPPPPPPPPMPELEPEPEPEPMPEPMPEPEPEPMAEEPSEAPAEAPAPAQSEREEKPLSQAELDRLFKATPEPEPMSSLSGDEGESNRVKDAAEIPEPEPIPPSLSNAADSDDAANAPKSKGGVLRALTWVGAGIVVVVGGLAAGAFFGRGFIVDKWPPAAEYYAMLGLSVESLGGGLDIRGVQSSRETEGEAEVLIVRGTVANVSSRPRKVPHIRVTLFDAKDKEIQSAVVQPTKPELAAGDNIGFRARLPDPSPLARRLEVTFTGEQAPQRQPPKGGG